MKKISTKIAILGGGSAGMSAYRAATAHTDDVYLIESHVFGTTCARVGCMPSKLLIAAAEAAHHAKHTAPFGVHVDGEVRVEGKEVMQRVRSERDRFVGFVVEDVESWPKDKRLHGQARFISNHTVLVGDDIELTAERFVIATGSSPIVLPVWKELGDKVLINDDVFSWETLPGSVAVFGPGVIGLELGQALSRLGVKVEIFGIGGDMGGISDPKVLAAAKEAFGEELTLHLDAKTKVSRTSNGNVLVEYSENGVDGQFEAEYMLAAIGRAPNVNNLGLENTDVERNERGVPKANPLTMQTSVPHIFIAGDASNQLPLLHEASDQGKIAGHNAGTYPAIHECLRRSLISVVFSDPQIACVGMRFSQMKAQFDRLDEQVAIGEVSFKNQGRSRVMLKNKGYLRVYANKQNGRFLGAEMVGPAAEHLAHLLAWAHQQKMTVAQMLDMPFYHPVIEEGLRTALRDAARHL